MYIHIHTSWLDLYMSTNHDGRVSPRSFIAPPQPDSCTYNQIQYESFDVGSTLNSFPLAHKEMTRTPSRSSEHEGSINLAHNAWACQLVSKPAKPSFHDSMFQVKNLLVDPTMVPFLTRRQFAVLNAGCAPSWSSPSGQK